MKLEIKSELDFHGKKTRRILKLYYLYIYIYIYYLYIFFR